MRFIILLIFISVIRAESTEYRYNGPPFPLLNENLFSYSNNTESVIIYHAFIETINTTAFKNLPKLKLIDLSFNFLTEIPVGTFSYTPYLENLVINSNNINGLKRNVFANMTYLKSVELEHNNISYIEDKSFENVPNLLSINLGNNNLKSLQLNFIDDSKGLLYLKLGGNPWICDPSLCELMNTVVSRFWREESLVPTCNDYPKITDTTTWQDMIAFSLPVIITDLRPHTSVSKVHLQCHICSKANLVWQFNDANITKVIQRYGNYSTGSRNVIQPYGNYYTVSRLTKSGYMDGNYKCFVVNKCSIPNCTYATTTLILAPASSATRIIVWSAVIIVLLSVSVYFVFFRNKSRNCGQNRSGSLFSLIRKK